MAKLSMDKVKIRIAEVFLILLAIIEFYPIFILFVSPFKNREEMTSNPFWLPAHITFENITKSFIQMKFQHSIVNSIIVTVFSLFFIIVFAAMASYPLGRIRSRFYNFFYVFFLIGIIVPYQLAMIPLYKLGVDLKFPNTYHGIIIIYIAIYISFPIFLYTGFIKSVPVQLEEAAVIDGCGKYRTFWYIIFPLLTPATTAVAVLNIINIWNDFLMSLLFLQRPNIKTVTVALFTFRGEYFSNWPQMFAGLVLTIIPIVIFFFAMQKYFIKGVTAGSVKG